MIALNSDRQLVARNRHAPRGVALVVAMLALGTGSATAQTCLTPSQQPGWAALHLGRTATEADLAGGEVGWRLSPVWLVSVAGEVTRFGASDPKRTSVAGGVAYRLPLQAAACVSLAAEHDRLGGLDVVSVPLGLVIGHAWTTQSGWRVVPQVEPRIAYRRASIPGARESTQRGSLRGGLEVAHRSVFFGGAYERDLVKDAGWTARARFGIGF